MSSIYWGWTCNEYPLAINDLTDVRATQELSLLLFRASLALLSISCQGFRNSWNRKVCNYNNTKFDFTFWLEQGFQEPLFFKSNRIVGVHNRIDSSMVTKKKANIISFPFSITFVITYTMATERYHKTDRSKNVIIRWFGKVCYLCYYFH